MVSSGPRRRLHSFRWERGKNPPLHLLWAVSNPVETMSQLENPKNKKRSSFQTTTKFNSTDAMSAMEAPKQKTLGVEFKGG